jgi:hypothetical protein
VFKNKAFLIVTVIILSLAVLASACAPAAAPKPATTTPPATTPPATVTPPTAPPAVPAATTPAATTPAAPAEIKTSFVSNTFNNATPAFSLQYPKSWIKGESSGDSVLNIAATDEQTSDAVAVNVIAENKDFAAAAKGLIEASGAFKQYNAKATLESQKTVTLADGKTTAYEAIFSAKIVIYDVYLYCFGTNTGGKSIVIVSYTLKNDDKNKQLLQEIDKTLTLK